MKQFELGKHYIMGVAPGWIFAGTVSQEDNEQVTFEPGNWIENVNAPWPEVAKDRSKIQKCSMIPRLRCRKSAILWDADCVKAVVHANAVKAVEDSE